MLPSFLRMEKYQHAGATPKMYKYLFYFGIHGDLGKEIIYSSGRRGGTTLKEDFQQLYQLTDKEHVKLAANWDDCLRWWDRWDNSLEEFEKLLARLEDAKCREKEEDVIQWGWSRSGSFSSVSMKNSYNFEDLWLLVKLNLESSNSIEIQNSLMEAVIGMGVQKLRLLNLVGYNSLCRYCAIHKEKSAYLLVSLG